MSLKLLTPQVYRDERGLTFELHRDERFPAPLVQSNLSRSHRGVVRGLHYQLEPAQAKLVTVVRGTIYDVVLDLRRSSPQFGQALAFELSEENRHQLYIPVGYAHGFCVVSDFADVLYHFSEYYHPGSEAGVLWNDPHLEIDWPVSQPVLSVKDAGLRPLREIPPDRLFP